MSVEVPGVQAPAQPDYFSHPAHRGLFDVFGWEWSNDPGEIVDRTQFLAKGDPRQPAVHLEITQMQAMQAEELFDSLDMLNERPAPAGSYDGVLIPGGQIDTNDDRVAFGVNQVERSDIQLRSGALIVVQGGPRKSFENELLRVRQEQQDAQITSSPAVVRRALSLTAEKIDETDQLALMLQKHVGQLTLNQMGLSLAGERLDSAVNDYVFRSSRLPANDIVLQHSKAVARPLGNPRHTTFSSTEDWLKSRYAPQAEKARILTVLNTPYIDRMSLDITAAVKKFDRSIEIVPCGPKLANLTTRMLLGEWARRLYVEQRALTV